eukprot:8742429-Pyramimonas_sp.AAC.1
MSLRAQRWSLVTGQQIMIEAPELFAEPANDAQQVGINMIPEQMSGAKFLIQRILEEYTTDRQDL